MGEYAKVSVQAPSKGGKLLYDSREDRVVGACRLPVVYATLTIGARTLSYATVLGADMRRYVCYADANSLCVL